MDWKLPQSADDDQSSKASRSLGAMEFLRFFTNVVRYKTQCKLSECFISAKSI